MFLDGDGGQNGRFMLFWETSLAGTPLDTHTHPAYPHVGGVVSVQKDALDAIWVTLECGKVFSMVLA